MPAIRRVVTAAITVVCLSAPLAWVARAQVPASGQPTQPSSPASGDDVLTEYRLPPDTLARSEALYRTSTVMLVVGTVYGLAVLGAPAGRPRRAALPRSRRARQPPPLRPGPGLRALADPHARRAQPAALDLRPPLAGAVRAVGAELGVVVLGLDQGRADRHRDRHAARLGPLCVPAAQPDAMVVLRLAGVDPRGPAARLHRSDLHRAALRHLRAAPGAAAGAGPGAGKGDGPRRPGDRARADVRDAGQRQGDDLQRLRHRHRRQQARGGVGQHVARSHHSRDDVRVRPRDGPLRPAAHLAVDRAGDRRPAGAAVSRLAPARRPAGAVRARAGACAASTTGRRCRCCCCS